MLTEAKIILPVKDNNNLDLSDLHNKLKKELIKKFGGVSIREETGCWLDKDNNLYEEPVKAYFFACEDHPASDFVIDAIAKDYGNRAMQKAIYVQYPDTRVNIIDLTVAEVNNA